MTHSAPKAKIALVMAALLASSPPHPASAQPQPTYSWQQPHAKVIGTGDLEWAPLPFSYTAGSSVRYIDYDGGDDNNSGRSRDQAWRHHPWDAAATANARAESGVHTYVFKRGVSYRGTLVADDSGQANEPIRLTSDPSWGEGEAVISGGRAVRGGWTRADAARAPSIPQPEKVWYIDLDKSFYPRAVWQVGQDGAINRIALARDPNWTVSNPDDVKSEWRTWKNSEKVKIPGENGQEQTRAWAFDPEGLTATDPDAFKGATIWTEYVSVMGQPYPAPVEAYDPQRHAIRVGGPWGDAAQYAPIWMNRYYLENLPRFLDSPGEYYYDNGIGRLYLRLIDDADPNATTIELAERTTQIDVRNHSGIEITGLSFRFGNVAHWFDRWWTDIDQDPAVIKVVGTCSDIRVANCTFQHVPMPILFQARGDSGVAMDRIAVTDNDIAHADYAGIEISAAGGRDKPEGVLDHVLVLRNRITDTGMRPRRAGQGHTLTVQFPRTAEVAGNILHRTGGAGVFIFGGKGGGGQYDVPLSRILVHHNKVTDSLLWTNDYGGIETWQGGPFYVYNNISGNPGGYWHFGHMGSKNKPADEINHASARFGFAYYFDGSFKNYVFNNIAWGKSSQLGSPLAATTAFHEVIGFLNTFANNTAYRFVAPFRRQVPQGGRGTYVGNVIADASEVFFRHADIDRPKDVNLAGAAADPESAADTLAYANNVLFGQPLFFGYFRRDGVQLTLESFQAALDKAGAVANQTGWNAEEMPLIDPANGDYRPTASSAAKDRGVKLFIPWSLSGTVGEWNFQPHPADLGMVPGQDWFMTSAYVEREMYRRIPRNDLVGHGLTLDSYVQGPLDDWTKSALTFNGVDQYLSLSQGAMTSDIEFAGRRRGGGTIKGSQRASLDMGVNSFVIEAYLRTEPGHTGGVIVSKMSDAAGYQLALSDRGTPILQIRQEGRTRTLAEGTEPVNNGEWHHLLVEVDRSWQTAMVYLGGKQSGSAGEIGSFDLSNSADFLVGKGTEGGFFAGAIDFLRVSRGSLADANTTIEELYAWQFDGPQFRDFAGRKPADGKRDAGALEAE